MKYYTTSLQAIDPNDGELKNWEGPHVPGISFEDAARFCEKNGLGYCTVTGQLIAEIPCDEKTLEPDFSKMTDVEIISWN